MVVIERFCHLILVVRLLMRGLYCPDKAAMVTPGNFRRSATAAKMVSSSENARTMSVNTAISGSMPTHAWRCGNGSSPVSTSARVLYRRLIVDRHCLTSFNARLYGVLLSLVMPSTSQYVSVIFLETARRPIMAVVTVTLSMAAATGGVGMNQVMRSGISASRYR